MTEHSIELLSLALAREYLSRKGYKSTLYAFDKETGKKNESIQNRRTLAEELKIIDLVRSNKTMGENRFQSFLEMIVSFLKKERKRDTGLKNRSSEDLNLASNTSIGKKNSSLSNMDKDGNHCSTCSCGDYDKKLCSSRKRRSHESKILKESENKPDLKFKNKFLDNEVKDKESLDFSVSFIEGLRKKKEVKRGLISPRSHKETLLVDSLDFSSDTLAANSSDTNNASNYPEKLYSRVDGITLETATELRTLIFGNARTSFNNEWRRQGFYFSKHPLLKYGLIQEKGGPCGLLASVQAWVLKFLLSGENKGVQSRGVPTPSDEEQTDALTKAFALILWRARTTNECVIVFPSRSVKFNTSSANYRNDCLTEKLDVYHFDNEHFLEEFLKKNITVYRAENGLVLFLYSVILSRGINNIRNDMDDPIKGTLMGRHGYCTQEMVNLLLVGQAISNVFDGDKVLGDDNSSDKTILHGIHSQSHIGFLSLFEHYNSCQVGDHYKIPIHPIWVVCSESHFSVLFSTQDVQKESEDTFDLYYFDGLGQQDEEIRLSVTPNGLKENIDEDKDLIPPLESCIRTKWMNSSVDWNGVDPIL